MDLIDDLKQRARLLHRAATSGDASVLQRLRSLKELRGLEDASEVRRRHCLALVASELGFEGWSHLTAVFQGQNDDFGTLLYPKGWSAFWNIWSADYEEARRIRAEHGGYLLAYKKHFFITDRWFVEALGLDPEDPDWERIGRDWARPQDLSARQRLYEKLIKSAVTSDRAASPKPASHAPAR